jgi:hypothetical protein
MQLGRSVAIELDTAAMGAPGDGFADGEAFVSTRTGGIWGPLVALSGGISEEEEPVQRIRFGQSLAMSEETLLVSAPGPLGGPDRPRVYPFARVPEQPNALSSQLLGRPGPQARLFKPGRPSDVYGPAACSNGCYGQGVATSGARNGIGCPCQDAGSVQPDVNQTLLCGNGAIDNGEECDDGNANDGDCCRNDCTRRETSSACNDGNGCTDDLCDELGRCANLPNAAPCDDGLFCNGADTCAAGTCSVHTGDPCLGGSECADACNESADTCNDPAGTACSDDGNICTDDVCDGTGSCSHPSNTAPCGDGLFCNGADVCTGGVCTHAGDPCAGGAECADSCDETADTCNDAAGTSCTDDGNVCTDDVCDGAGTCVHPSNTAPCDDDGNVCTDDVCAEGACSHPSNTAPCNDGKFCNGDADTCSAGACSGSERPCGDLSCDEATDQCKETCEADADCEAFGDACNVGRCDLESGDCFVEAGPDGVACDDALFCTATDTCTDGVCTGTGDPCAGNDICRSVCDEESDTCSQTVGTPCDDGDACTENDACSDGECAGSAVECESGEICEPATGICAAVLCGDATGDGRITVSDALFALQASVGSATCALAICDLNCDGAITSNDALRILQKAVGLEPPESCACA